MTTTTRPRPSMLTVRSSALSLLLGRHRRRNLPATGALGPRPVLPPTIRDQRQEEAQDGQRLAGAPRPGPEPHRRGDPDAEPDPLDQHVPGADPGAVHHRPVGG